MNKNLRKAHRWVGLVASLWLLLLATTGLLLQHTHDWKLDKSYINNQTLLKLYGIGNQFIAFEQGQHKLVQIDGQLIQNNRVTIKLEEEINGAVLGNQNWIIATNSQILWINTSGQIIQSLDELDGLHTPISNIGNIENRLYYKSNEAIYDLETIQINDTSKVHWSKPIENNLIKQQAIKQTSKDYLSLEQFIFDLHAGITSPSIFNDIAAIALILLSLSGLFLFFRKTKTNKQTR